MATGKILIVDDEPEIKELIRMYMAREGFDVIWASNGERACELAFFENPDLIILDVLMPGIDGIDTCTRLRRNTDVPILFLSCKNQDSDKILGLAVGGDDYITKPFSPSVLVARVKAHLRRNSQIKDSKAKNRILSYKGLEINLDSHSVTLDDSPVSLTAKEFEILAFLAKNPNRVFYSSQIFERIWVNGSLEGDERTIMVHISNLRKKIERNPADPKFIVTVRGFGYKFNS